MQIPNSSGVAIVGMAGLFPNAPTLQAYWENIVNCTDAVTDPPEDWERDLFAPEDGHGPRIYCVRGGYLGKLAEFNPLEHGVTPSSIDGTEPDHFLALRIAREALADAGYLDKKFNREATEVIIGRGTYVNRGNTTVVQHGLVIEQVLRLLRQLHPEHTDEELEQIRRNLVASLPPFTAETAPGLVPNIISGRIANRLDLMGPNFVVDAACASSLVAVDLGMRDLLSGRCDLAVVGGVHASTPPPILMIFCQLDAISRQGQIRPFDRRADGTILGEGVGMVVLKRLEDAQRDGDRCYAIVKGVGTASDGRALGLLAPRLEGEMLALRRAYENAGVATSTIGLIEAHGTSTSVGDAVEIQALQSVFGSRQRTLPTCAMGSVKSMIGHLLPAAGIAGLIKAALALYQRVLPPTMHCEEPNPELDLERSMFYLNSEVRPWFQSASEPRRAGVNAFGFGGINAHAVLEEYKEADESALPSFHRNWDCELVIVSAADRVKLQQRLRYLQQLIAQSNELSLIDVAYTLNQENLSGDRVAIVAKSLEDLCEKLRLAADRLEDPQVQRIKDISGIYYFAQGLAKDTGVAFVFPGEGSQYPRMLGDLCLHFPEVRKAFELVDRAFSQHPRGLLPTEVIFPPSQPGESDEESAETRIWDMDLGAEAVFAASQAMLALLRNLGIRADAMLGHSTGEHSALLASGALTVENEDDFIGHVLGVNSVYQELCQKVQIPEAVLLAVGGADPEMIRSVTVGREGLVDIAMDNCPHQIVLSCAPEVAHEVTEFLQKNLAVCQVLPFSRAYHTPRFDIFSNALREYFDGLGVVSPRCRLYSCVNADRYPGEADGIRHLASVQWSSPVRFRETIEKMYEDGIRIFVEVGPKNVLSGFIADILRGKEFSAIPANVDHTSGISQLLHAVGQLVAHGTELRLDYLFKRRCPRRVELGGSTEPQRRRGTMKLHLGLQPFRLSENFMLPSHPRSELPAPTGAATAAVRNRVSTPAAMRAGSGSSTARFLQEHFKTMETFLDSQSVVMRQLLEVRKTVQKMNHARRPGVQQKAERPAVRLPFAGQILEKESGLRIRIRRQISLDEDLLLKDHTLGRHISVADPDLISLPLVPLTLSMEMLAECAALLRPGKVLIGMREVRAHRWLTVENSGPLLELTGEIDPAAPDEVLTRMYEVRSDGEISPVCVEGMMIFGDAYPAAVSGGHMQLENERESSWSSDRLYRDGMFHGPAFRAVISVDRTADNGTNATLEVLPREGLFKSYPNPTFVTDPVILDATGQVVAFWTREVMESGYDIFPYRLKELKIFAPPPEPGTRLSCAVSAQTFGRNQLTSDIDVVNPDGKLTYHLAGWEDRRFELPEEFLKLRVSPREAFLSRKLNLEGGPAEDNIHLCLLDIFSAEFLEAHNAIWTKVLAHLVLGRNERHSWDDLGKSEKRRRHWLLGRAVAKDAVRYLLSATRGIKILPADIEILAEESGIPKVKLLDPAGKGSKLSASISHSGEVAVALVTDHPNALLGVDVESIRAHAETVTQLSSTDRESQILAGMNQVALSEWRLRFWCAKEAFAKAIGKGLSSIYSLEVVDADTGTGELALRLSGDLAGALPELAPESQTCRTARDGDYVFATFFKR